MKKETLAKLNYVLDSMQLSKEHKAALTDVFNDISSSGGGIDKFVLTLEEIPLEPGEDNQTYKLNINGKYDVVLDTDLIGVACNAGVINNEVYQYIISNLDSYMILSSFGGNIPVRISPSSYNIYCFIDLTVLNENGPSIDSQCIFVLQPE